jgi:hypothetical protein
MKRKLLKIGNLRLQYLLKLLHLVSAMSLIMYTVSDFDKIYWSY